MKIMLICIFCFLGECSLSQVFVSQNNEFIPSKRIFIDSNYQLQRLVPLEVENFNIQVLEINYDEVSGAINIIGNICWGNVDSFCVGLPGVEIFFARKVRNSLKKRKLLATSKIFDKDSLIASFIISFNDNHNDYLYFYHPYFRALEIDVSQLKKFMKGAR